MTTRRQGIGHEIYQGHQIIVHRSGPGGFVAYISKNGEHGNMTRTPVFQGDGAKRAAAGHARLVIDQGRKAEALN